MTIEESMHVVFDETNPKLQDQVSKNVDEEDLLQISKLQLCQCNLFFSVIIKMMYKYDFLN